LKDTLKIQKSTTKNYEGFMKKFSLFALKFVCCQLFKKFCNKKFNLFKGWAFTKIRFYITNLNIEKDYLKAFIQNLDTPLLQVINPVSYL